jgi:hypothetical protein
MVKALPNGPESHELFAIIAGVPGVIAVLALILVVGGHLIVTAELFT